MKKYRGNDPSTAWMRHNEQPKPVSVPDTESMGLMRRILMIPFTGETPERIIKSMSCQWCAAGFSHNDVGDLHVLPGGITVPCDSFWPSQEPDPFVDESPDPYAGMTGSQPSIDAFPTDGEDDTHNEEWSYE